MKISLKSAIISFLVLTSVHLSAQVRKQLPGNGRLSNGGILVDKSQTGTIPKKQNGGMQEMKNYNFSKDKVKISPSYTALVSSLTKDKKLADGTTLHTTLYFGGMRSANNQNGLKETRKAKPTSQKDGWTCTNNNVKVSLNDESFMNASNEQQSANLYPGAVYTFDNFFNGSFKNETAARNPLRITTSAQGVGGNVYEDVASPTPDEIKNAVNKLYRRMPASRAMASYQSTIYECNSLADQMLKINAGGGGYGFKADFGYNTANHDEHRYFLIDCTQEMYSVNASMPTVGVFVNPPDGQKAGMMMMGNVTYGFRVLVSFDTKITTSAQGVKFNASYSGFGASANFGIQSLVRDASDETTVKMYIVGGQNEGLISMNKNDILNKLNQYFKTTTLQNAKPIKYQFRNMNNEVVTSRSATDYFPEQHCVPSAPDASKVMWKVTLNLDRITNETSMQESIHLGVHQSAIISGTARPIIPNENKPKINGGTFIYWGGYKMSIYDYEEPRTFSKYTTPSKSISWVIPQSDLENNAHINITSDYIAMVSTRIGGRTNESTNKSSLSIPLKDLLTRQGDSKSLSINFNNRVFKFDYTLAAQKQ